MSSINFSLSERVIINPVLQMRAALLDDPESPPAIGEKIFHFIKAEIVARVAALFTFVFAVPDAFIHLLTGIYKGGYLLLRKCCKIPPASWNKPEVYAHFRHAALYAGVTLVGSTVGTIWPGVFKHFQQVPLDPSDGGDDSAIPESVQEQVQAVRDGGEQLPLDGLKEFWARSNLSEKHWFVHAFNQDDDKFRVVRQTLAATVYRPIAPVTGRQVQWLNSSEVSSKVPRKVNLFSMGYFFHATPTKEGLKSILQNGVEVRHEKAYRGAFVSTTPEYEFGRYVLAFKRNIERLSPLEHGFTIGQNTYWAGFSQNIPVNDTTLAYIILQTWDDGETAELQKNCKEWTGRDIQVAGHWALPRTLQEVTNLEMGIPKEWPDEGEQAGQKILNVMKLAIAQPKKALAQPSNANSSQRLAALC